MKTLPSLFAGALLAGAMPAAAFAGVTFTATARVESPAGRLAGLEDSTVRGWVDGEKGRVEFVDSRNPATPKGDVLLTTDGGRTIRYFDLGHGECRRWDARLPRETRVGPGSPVSTKFVNVRVAKTVDEGGPEVAGFPTRHYRVESAYDTVIEGPGSANRSHTSTVEDLWIAEGLRDSGFGAWLTTGIPGAAAGELGAKLAAISAGIIGAPLKRVSVTSVAFPGRKPVTTTTRVEVIRLRRESVPPASFDPPLDCTNRTGQER
jgi:hypothetical protein